MVVNTLNNNKSIITMIVINNKYCCLFVGAVTLLTVSVQGFTTTPPVAFTTRTNNGVVSQQQHQTRRIPSSSSSSLSMGMFEDFLSGQDDSQREKENEDYIAQKLQQRVDRINALEETIEELDDDELEAKTAEFKQRLADGEDINGPLLEEAFAVVREAAWYVFKKAKKQTNNNKNSQFI